MNSRKKSGTAGTEGHLLSLLRSSELPDDSDYSGSRTAPEMPRDLHGEELSPGCNQGCSSLSAFTSSYYLLPPHVNMSLWSLKTVLSFIQQTLKSRLKKIISISLRHVLGWLALDLNGILVDLTTTTCTSPSFMGICFNLRSMIYGCLEGAWILNHKNRCQKLTSCKPIEKAICIFGTYGSIMSFKLHSSRPLLISALILEIRKQRLHELY